MSKQNDDSPIWMIALAAVLAAPMIILIGFYLRSIAKTLAAILEKMP